MLRKRSARFYGGVWVVALATFGVWTGAAVAQEGGESSDLEMRVVILGTGTPNADPERSGPGVAVVVGDRAYLIDSGPGIVRRAAAASAAHDLPALGPSYLNRLFLTHLTRTIP